MKRSRNLLPIWVIFFFVLSACVPGEEIATVKLAGLFSLSGDLVSLGQDSQAAMEIALLDINALFAQNGLKMQLVATIEDTLLDPATALEKLQLLYSSGINIFIGPSSSAEVEVVKEFVDGNNILMISHYSTAGRLAVEGDNIYRFCPPDTAEGPAVAELLKADGILAVVPLWRNDTGNQGLHDAVKDSFESAGGIFYEGYRYDTATLDFSTALATLKSQVLQAQASHGDDKVAVYFAAFNEAVTVFRSAASSSELGAVKWYGGDGLALNQEILSDPVATQFAALVNCQSPTLSLDEAARDIWEPLSQRIYDRTGNNTNFYALAVYDAVWVLAETWLSTRAQIGDFNVLKQEYLRAANHYFGATGWTVLNAAGDRSVGNFEFWAIHEINGIYQWVSTATYYGALGQLIKK